MIKLIKKIQNSALILLSAILIGTTLVPLIQVEASARPLSDLNIVIDPGHGGRDPGAVAMHNGVQIHESDVVLDISLQIRDLLRQTGVNVHMTRTTDIDRTLAERARFANNLNADLFVSVHLNAFTNSAANGTETFYIGGHGQSALAASAEGFYVSDEDQFDLEMIEEGMQPFEMNGRRSSFDNEFDEEVVPHHGMNPYLDIVPASSNSNRVQNSRLLAQSIQRRKIQRLGLTDRGVRTANFHVLRETNMAAALSEIGFLTNPGDRAVILTEQGRRLSAEAIYLGILDYLVARGHDVPDRFFDLNRDNNVTNPPNVTTMQETGVTRQTATLRRGAGSNYGSIRSIRGNTNVLITGRTDSFYRVIVNGTTGWLRRTSVARTRQNAIVTASSAHVRAGRGTDYRSLTQLSRGHRVMINQSTENWSRVTTNGHTGWIRNSDLSISGGMRPGRTTVNNVRVHSRPRANSEVRHILPRHAHLMILQRTESSDGWSQIRISHNGGTLNGWVRTNQIEARAQNRRLVRDGALRGGSSTNYSRLRTIPRNTNVTIRSRAGNWYHVHVYVSGRRHYGWLHRDNLRRLPLP